MLYWHVRAKAEDPLRSPQILALKEKLLASPKDESLKEQIRALDLELRRRYFYQVSLNRAGGWLVVGAVMAFLVGEQKGVARRALFRCRSRRPAALKKSFESEPGRGGRSPGSGRCSGRLWAR